jgi:hypothetical protein
MEERFILAYGFKDLLDLRWSRISCGKREWKKRLLTSW